VRGEVSQRVTAGGRVEVPDTAHAVLAAAVAEESLVLHSDVLVDTHGNQRVGDWIGAYIEVVVVRA
jgi:hypothetical protein